MFTSIHYVKIFIIFIVLYFSFINYIVFNNNSYAKQDTLTSSNNYCYQNNAGSNYQSLIEDEIKNHIEDKLKNDGIPFYISNKFDIRLIIHNSDCTIDKNPFWPKDVPQRHICNFVFDINLYIEAKKLADYHGKAVGIGVNKITACEQANLFVVEKIYPIIINIAFPLSQQMELNMFKKQLNGLVNDNWNFIGESDIDSLIKEIQKELDKLTK